MQLAPLFEMKISDGYLDEYFDSKQCLCHIRTTQIDFLNKKFHSSDTHEAIVKKYHQHLLSRCGEMKAL